MPVLIVKLGEKERHIPFVPDQSYLFACLDFDDFFFENLYLEPMGSE